jgi:hypothetical protein
VYCFVNWVPAKEGDGLEPEVPQGVEGLLLADLPDVEWGLCEVDAGAAEDAWVPETPVGAELEGLIESGKRYPPALALARQEVVQVFCDRPPTQTEFANAYAVAIQAHLSRQHEAPFVVARSTRDEDQALVQGEWYWVLRISGTPPQASWVSDDFHIHRNDMTDFDFTGQQLKRLGYAG